MRTLFVCTRIPPTVFRCYLSCNCISVDPVSNDTFSSHYPSIRATAARTSNAKRESMISIKLHFMLYIDFLFTRFTHLIEAMEIPFAVLLLYDARFLEQVVGDYAADGVSFKVKLNIHVLSKAARIVVAVGLCIPKRFEYGIALDQNVFHALDFVVARGICHGRYVLHDDF